VTLLAQRPIPRKGRRPSSQSVDEAAQVLGIPAATVKTRMFYARKKLGEWLKAPHNH
jgi:hypothetical protein